MDHPASAVITPAGTPPPEHDPTVQALVTLSHALRDAADQRLAHVHLGWGVIVASLAALVGLLLWRDVEAARSAQPLIPPAVTLRLDSLAATEHAAATERASLVAAARAAQSAAEAATLAQNRAETDASALRVALQARLAQGVTTRALGGRASASDSAGYWHELYDLRTEESDSLLVALTAAHVAHAADTAALALQTTRASEAEARLAALTRVNDQLRAATAHAEPGCAILWKIRCPSRVASYVLGAVSAVVVVAAVRR